MGTDDTVTLFIHKAEMGQGTVTSLSMLLAEELECDWKKIRTEFPGVSREYGANAGRVRQREHSDVRGSSLRRAGAAAREMLIEAAAQAVGRRSIGLPRRKQHGRQHRDQGATDLRQPGRGRVETAGAGQVLR